MKKNKAKKSFTLVEVLIATGILSLVTGAIMAVMMTGLSSWQVGEAKTQGQQDARRAMQAMTQELRLSNSGHIQIMNEYGSVIDTGTGISVRFQVPLYDKINQKIDLDTDGYKKWGAGSSLNYWICYKLDTENPSQLKRVILNTNKTEVTNISSVLANNVQSLNFIGLPNNTYSPTSVQVILVTTNISSGKSINSTLTSRVWLRNLS